MSDPLCNLLTITKTTKVDCDRAALASIAEHVQAWHVRELEHCETLERVGLDRDRLETDFERARGEAALRREAAEDERARNAEAVKSEVQIKLLTLVAEVLPTIVKKVLGGADDTDEDLKTESEPRRASADAPVEENDEAQTWDFINFVNETMAHRDADSSPVTFNFRFHGDLNAPPACTIIVTKASALWAKLFTLDDDDFWVNGFASAGVLSIQTGSNTWTFTRDDALIAMMGLE